MIHPLRSHRSPHSGLSRPTRPAKLLSCWGGRTPGSISRPIRSGFRRASHPTPEHRGEAGEFHEAAHTFATCSAYSSQLLPAPRHPSAPQYQSGPTGCRGAAVRNNTPNTSRKCGAAS